MSLAKSRLPLTIALLVLAACGQDHEAGSPATGPEPQAVTTASAAPAYDLQFLDTMSKHHQGAVDMAAAAQGKISNKELKALVQRIPADQQKEIDQMKSWREQWYPGAATAENMQMPGMSMSMMDMGHMQSMKPGRDYDLMFIDMMVPHHEGAILMSQEALAKAERAEVKALAQKIIDAQTKEIEAMKRWKASLTSRSGT